MTRREDMMQRCPEKVNEKYSAGVYGCPLEAGYKGRELCGITYSVLGKEDFYKMRNQAGAEMCRACWSMEAIR